MAREGLRRVAADLLISLGVVALSLGAILSVARRALFTPDAFADRLAASLADPRVASFVADRITTAVLRQDPDLTAFRPLIAGTARGAVSTASFQALVRTAARTAHAGVFSAGGRTLIVSVPDVGVLLRTALAKANPALADKVPPQVQGVLASLGTRRVDRAALRLWEVSRRTRWLVGGLGFAGVLLAAAGVLSSSSRQGGLGRLALDLVVAGLALYLLVPIGRILVSSLPQEPLARSAAAGLWDAYTISLRTWAFVLGGIGLVLGAAAHSLVERLDPGDAARRFAAWLTVPPAGNAARAVRGALLLAAGTLAVAKPAGVATLLVLAVGGVTAFVGLRELFEIAVRALPRNEEETPSTAVRTAGLRAGVVLGLAAVLAAGIAWFGRPHPVRARPTDDACNGAAQLCGRRLDDVVFPATHNSMSAADVPGWLFPQQERGIAGQLEDGVRALLFDVHYGVPVEGRIKTDLDAEMGSREKLEAAVGKEGLDAAMRIRDRLTGKPEGPRGLYLCHGFCELGAQPLKAEMERVHAFLVQNPDEVLVFVVEDYVSPQELAAVFAESGLDGLVYRGPAAPPWPTLREMIDGRQRVLVTIVSGRPGVSWIHPAFEVFQETPYKFKQPSEMSCAPNRGGTSGPLFLMNNWIETVPNPKPSNAAVVNAYDALVSRARHCRAERGRVPNVLAVDFYRTGGLLRAVRTLNGLDEPPAD